MNVYLVPVTYPCRSSVNGAMQVVVVAEDAADAASIVRADLGSDCTVEEPQPAVRGIVATTNVRGPFYTVR